MSEGDAALDHEGVAGVIDLDAYPLHRPSSSRYADLVARCRADLRSTGMFDLSGFLRQDAIDQLLGLLRPLIDRHSFEHRRRHNIYFLPSSQLKGVDPSHPALAEMETINRTVCADQFAGSRLLAVYEWPGLARFLEAPATRRGWRVRVPARAAHRRRSQLRRRRPAGGRPRPCGATAPLPAGHVHGVHG